MAKSVFREISTVQIVPTPTITFTRIILVAFLVQNGTLSDLTVTVDVDPADSSAVIRQKMVDGIIAQALLDFGQVLDRQDVFLPTFSTGLSTPASETRTDTFTTTAVGTIVDTSLAPLTSFALVVEGLTNPAASWDVRLEGSLDGTNFTQILQHTQLVGDKQVIFSGSNRSPALFIRSRVAGLLLGTASAINVKILGVP